MRNYPQNDVCTLYKQIYNLCFKTLIFSHTAKQYIMNADFLNLFFPCGRHFLETTVDIIAMRWGLFLST